MTTGRVGELARAIRSAPSGQRIGLALAYGLVDLYDADVAVVWLPAIEGPPVATDIFIGGTSSATAADVLVALAGGDLRTWLAAEGFSQCAAVSRTTRAGCLGVGWRTTAPVHDGAETTLALFAALAEATRDLRDTTVALKDAEAQVVRAERHRTNWELASGLVHDFNNCLTTILGFSELAVDTMPQSDPHYAGLLNIRTVALDAAVLARRLHAVGRTPAPQDATVVDLRDIARSMPELTRPRWNERAEVGGIDLAIVVDAGPVPPVYVVTAEIRELLTNLLFNAFDAMPDGGQVTIALTTGEADGWAQVTVRDEGVGMSPEVLAHAFEPFFSTKGDRGSGLGLSACRSTAARFGGTLTAQTTPGTGSAFTLRLPPAPASLQTIASGPDDTGQETAARNNARASLGAHRRVLLVDDQEEVRRSIEAMLRALGHEVLTASDGPGALTTAERDPLDLVITDLGMPGMNGAEVASRLRSTAPHLPVVMMTGWGLDASDPLPDNVSLALVKPVTMKALGDAIIACSPTPATVGEHV